MSRKQATTSRTPDLTRCFQPWVWPSCLFIWCKTQSGTFPSNGSGARSLGYVSWVGGAGLSRRDSAVAGKRPQPGEVHQSLTLAPFLHREEGQGSSWPLLLLGRVTSLLASSALLAKLQKVLGSGHTRACAYMNACVCVYIRGLFLPISDTPSTHCCSHFADKETEALGGEVPSPRSLTWHMAKPG